MIKNLQISQHIYGTIRRIIVGKDLKKLMKFYTIMADLVILDGFECWIFMQLYQERLEAAKMGFLRGMVGCRFMDHRQNEYLKKE